jgi:hypothetical protein
MTIFITYMNRICSICISRAHEVALVAHYLSHYAHHTLTTEIMKQVSLNVLINEKNNVTVFSQL